jgi:rhamnose transport system substrate-binding protein
MEASPTMDSRLKLTTLCALALGAALLVGCGPKEDTSATTGGTPAPTTGGEAKTKLVFIPKNSGNPYFTQVEKGFTDSAGTMALDFSSQAPATGDATSQISVIKDQVQRGVKVIVISANSPDALNEALDQAKEKGVMVITVDADLTGNEEHRSVGILPTDFSGIGTSQIELMGSLMNYEGEFAILSATTDAPNQNAWIETMKAALKTPKYSKMKLVDVVYGDDQAEKSSTEMQSLLTKHPNLKGIIAPTTVGLSAAAGALEVAGVYPGGPKAKGAGVILTGLGMPNELKGAVEKGVVTKFQLWDPADMGIIASYIASKKLELKPGDEFEVPGKGKFTVADKNIVFAGKLLTFDKDNIGNYNF